jgi:hypothetical protein
MSIERNSDAPAEHESVENHADDNILIEPKKGLSTAEAAREGRDKFQRLLRATDLRSLVRYIRDGRIDLNAVPEIPVAWKKHFNTNAFLNERYTWINPRLYLLTPQAASAWALQELVGRLRDEPHEG